MTITQGSDGSYTLLRDGKPFFIKGGGRPGTPRYPGGLRRQLHPHLGDRFAGRTGGRQTSRSTGRRNWGSASRPGIWIEHERHGFNYDDPAQVQKQRDAVRAAVRKYKDSPAILMWGLGNEMEGPTANGTDPRTQKIWKELNALAAIVKEEDKTHPVMTVIASAASAKVKGIMEFYPNIDVLGVNAYAGGGGVGQALKDAGWKKPFVLTEFGPPGQWEVPKTSWGAPVEPSSWEKAGGYYATSQMLAEHQQGHLAGQLRVSLGVQAGGHEHLVRHVPRHGREAALRRRDDALVDRRVAGQPQPENHRVQDGAQGKHRVRGQDGARRVEVTDAENDPLTFEWKVVAESTDRQEGGDAEKAPPTIPDCVDERARRAGDDPRPDAAGRLPVVRHGPRWQGRRERG